MKRVDDILASIVRGKTFLDIGPCWGVTNEKLSVASKYGASKVTGIDIFPEDHESWVVLRKRLRDMQVTCDLHPSQNLFFWKESYDVVYCSGVIYHQADPFHFMFKMHELTQKHLILKSTVTPKQVGSYNLPAGACIFMPSVTEEDREVFAKDWEQFLHGKPAIGLSSPKKNWDVRNPHGWWWLFTPEALISICTSMGFEVKQWFLLHDNREVAIHAVKQRDFKIF